MKTTEVLPLGTDKLHGEDRLMQVAPGEEVGNVSGWPSGPAREDLCTGRERSSGGHGGLREVREWGGQGQGRGDVQGTDEEETPEV